MKILNIFKRTPYKSFLSFATISMVGYNMQFFNFQRRSHCDATNINTTNTNITKKTEENVASSLLCRGPSSTLHNNKCEEIMQDVKQRAEQGEWIPFLYPIYFEFWTLITLMEIMKKPTIMQKEQKEQKEQK
jgi:hypothetical protein